MYGGVKRERRIGRKKKKEEERKRKKRKRKGSVGRRGKEEGKEEDGLYLVHEVTWKKRDAMTYFQDR